MFIDGIYSNMDALKKSVADGKKSVASAISAKGVSTATDASFAVMAGNINNMATKQYNAGYNAGKLAALVTYQDYTKTASFSDGNNQQRMFSIDAGISGKTIVGYGVVAWNWNNIASHFNMSQSGATIQVSASFNNAGNGSVTVRVFYVCS